MTGWQVRPRTPPQENRSASKYMKAAVLTFDVAIMSADGGSGVCFSFNLKLFLKSAFTTTGFFSFGFTLIGSDRGFGGLQAGGFGSNGLEAGGFGKRFPVGLETGGGGSGTPKDDDISKL